MFNTKCGELAKGLHEVLTIKRSKDPPTIVKKSFSYEKDKIQIHEKPYANGKVITLNKNDINTLNEEEKLNDEVINSAAILFELDYPTTKACVLSTYFYNFIMDHDWAKATDLIYKVALKRKWSYDDENQDVKRVLAKYDFILIPINTRNTHWVIIYLDLKQSLNYCLDSARDLGENTHLQYSCFFLHTK